MAWFTNRIALILFFRRNIGRCFLCLVLIVFFNLGLRSGRQSRALASFGSQDGDDDTPLSGQEYIQHPIPRLMEEAEEAFRQKLSSQSKTLQDAVREYTRRYKRPPPKGFDAWWEFAEKYETKLVDEYDGLMEDLAPFWELPGEEIRRRSEQAGYLPSIDMLRIRNGESHVINIKSDFKDTEVSARAFGFKFMIANFVKMLPDMDFPVNALAESRVLVPWERLTYSNITTQNSSAGIESMLGGKFDPAWPDGGGVWQAWRRTCDPGSAARKLYSALRPIFPSPSKNYFMGNTVTPGEDFFFVNDTSATLDFCSYPYAHNQQGHFYSDWRSIGALYPVFSPAKAKGFLDIRIPSHYYYGSTPQYTYGWDPVNLELRDVDPMEVPWEDKVDMVFWRGATTGGGNHPPGFSNLYHRHRFVRMASESSNALKTVTFAHPSSSTTNWVSVEAPTGQLNEETLDAAFVKITAVDNYPGGLPALKEHHRFSDSVPLGTHWGYKYLADLDGMSYSGRFLAFLASDSVPIKATVYKEFFFDWIQPWVHFIPLSSSYREIYNVVAFFSGPPKSVVEAFNSSLADMPPEDIRSVDGDRRLKRIARAGKRWKQTMGRKIDLEVYVYRLCLEWARLWADDRDSMSYLG